MSYSRVGVVTGANKGIGLAIVRQLALQYPKSPLNDGPCLIYLTARDQGRGEAALKALHSDEQLKQEKALKADGGLSEIRYHQLDITDRKSLQVFADYLKKTHGDGIDFAINNAGMAMDGFDVNVVRTTIGCNYYSTMEASHTFLSLMKPQGRLVNVGSVAGLISPSYEDIRRRFGSSKTEAEISSIMEDFSKYSKEIQDRFHSAKTEADISSIMEDFTKAVEAGKEKEAGYPSAAYAVSKAGLIGGTKVLASVEKERGSKVLINCVCPGYVNTDMTKGKGKKTPDQGAQTPVQVAIHDINGVTGTFWAEGKQQDW